jgi:hypothetical protein
MLNSVSQYVVSVAPAGTIYFLVNILVILQRIVKGRMVIPYAVVM